MDLTQPFRGSHAVACGAVTRGVLAGPRYRRLEHDIYVTADREVDLTLRSLAALLVVEPDGVLSGYSAAELLRASSGPPGTPAEVTAPGFRNRVPGLVVHRDRLEPDEVCTAAGVPVTSPARTAFDLARWLGLVEGVVAVDALAHKYPFGPADLRALRSRHLGVRDSRKLDAVLGLVDRRSESPMETRMRVALEQAGLPPCVQHAVTVDGEHFRLDLAYPAAMLGVEYDGGHHREADQALHDLEREALLAAAGWKVLRFRAGVVLHRPHVVVARTRAELARRIR